MLALAGCLFYFYYKVGKFNNITGELYNRLEEKNNAKGYDERHAIDISTIDHVVIKKFTGEADSTIKQLTYNQAKILANDWNTSKAIGPCIYLPTYYVVIFLQDGTQRSFRANGQSIKENNDWCFEIGETNYFDKLWAEIK